MTPLSGFVNIWNNAEEMEMARDMGRVLARKWFPGDETWENRCVNLAQGLRPANWDRLTALPRASFIKIVESVARENPNLNCPPEENTRRG